MATDVQVNVVGLLPLKRQIELMAMPRDLRRRMIYRVAQRVIRDSKARVRQQRDLTGRPFEERKRKRRGGRKMLAKLAKELQVVNNNSLEAIIGFRRGSSARIAVKHQYGFVERLSARQFSADTKPGFYEQPATRKQGKALREAGFKIKKANGRGTKSPTLKWVTENLTVGQAGFALRQLRAWADEKVKTSWTTILPARSFLGASAQDISDYIDLIFTQMKQEIARAR